MEQSQLAISSPMFQEYLKVGYPHESLKTLNYFTGIPLFLAFTLLWKNISSFPYFLNSNIVVITTGITSITNEIEYPMNLTTYPNTSGMIINRRLLYAIKYEFTSALSSNVVPLEIIIVETGNMEPWGIPSSIITKINDVKLGRNGNEINTSDVIIIETINGLFIYLNGLHVMNNLVANEIEKKYIYGE